VRRLAVRLITFAGGLFFLLEFLLPGRAGTGPPGAATQPGPPTDAGNLLTPYLGNVTNFLIVVGTMAFLLGPFNLVRSHVKTFLSGQKGRLESAVFLVFLVTAMLAASLKSLEASRVQAFFQGLYEALFHGVTAAFFTASMALLTFYLVSAAHRAFRLNSLDAGVMMGAAVIVLLGLVPVGDLVTYALPEWLHPGAWAQWILMHPNAAVQRAVTIGACGGAIATGLRHWLSLGTGAE
jgi:hypothetical protein